MPVVSPSAQLRKVRSLAPLLLAALVSQAYAADVSQAGTNGAAGSNGTAPAQAGTSGAAGGNISATAGSNVDTSNSATAIGGLGGNGGSGAAGTSSAVGGRAGAGAKGGNATATAATAPLNGDAQSTANAYGGAGGAAGLAGADGGAGAGASAAGGNGGSAVASGQASSLDYATSYVNAVGGNGGFATGAGSLAGNGGTARATATVTAGLSANATASAYGGEGNTAGNANARAIARATQVGGSAYAAAQAAASRANVVANADAYTRGNGTATARSYNSFSSVGAATAHSHSAGTSGRSIVTGSTAAADGYYGIAATSATFGAGNVNTHVDLAQSPKSNGTVAYSFADGEPPLSQVADALGSHAQVAAALAAVTPQIAGIGVMGATRDAFAQPDEKVYAADARYAFSIDGSTGIFVGLLDFTGYDSGAPIDLDFRISNFGTLLLDESFTSLTAADAYFTDHALQLGTFSGDVDLLISFSLTSATMQGAGISYLVATGALTSAVPEPGSWAFLLAGLGVLGMLSRRHIAAKRSA